MFDESTYSWMPSARAAYVLAVQSDIILIVSPNTALVV
jgi:hypothetical protein